MVVSMSLFQDLGYREGFESSQEWEGTGLIGEDVAEVGAYLGFEEVEPVAVAGLLEDFAAIVFEVGLLPLAVGAEENVMCYQAGGVEEFCAALYVRVGVPPLLDCAAPCAEHFGVVAEVLESLVGLEGTAYAAESALGVESAFAVVVERVALYASVGNKGGNIVVGPGEDGEDDVDVVLLVATVDATDDGIVFGVAGGAAGAFAAANALDGDVEDFVFFHLIAAEAAAAGGHAFLGEKVEEGDFWLEDFDAVLAAVC